MQTQPNNPDDIVRILWQGKYLGNKLVLYITPFPQQFGYLYITDDFNLEGSVTLDASITAKGAVVIVNTMMNRIESTYMEELLRVRTALHETLH